MRRSILSRVILLGVFALSDGGPLPVFAQSSAFSYQGHLYGPGGIANGKYDLSFTLFNASSAGSAVATPVTNSATAVTNGLFMVTLDFGAGPFSNGAPRWVEIGVRTNGNGAFTTLSPRQALLATPYSTLAGTASNVVNGVVVKSVNNLKDNVTLSAGANVTITPSGNTLTIASSAGSGSSIWSLNGSSAYYTGGNVGVGQSNPGSTLEVAGLNGNGLLYLTAPRPNIFFRDTLAGNARGAVGGFDGGLRFYTESWLNGYNSSSLMSFNTNGNLGIGTTAPAHHLSIISNPGTPSWTANAWKGAIEMDNASAIGWQANNSGARFGMGHTGGGFYMFRTASDPGTTGSPATYDFMIDDQGRVGIGTIIPSSQLEIMAQDALKMTGVTPFLTFRDSNAGNARAAVQSVAGNLVFETDTYLSGANANNYATLANSGNFSVKNITIRGGADVAEPFDFSDAQPAAGSVVVIDDRNPGKLKVSSRTYDRRVAGIISGANGVNPGLSLHQEGLLDGSNNVALSGRVYVLADATKNAIEPGDLLTTSDTPGHAMKVTDYSRAQGAVIGKAMSRLAAGKGMVLVLVTLQ